MRTARFPPPIAPLAAINSECLPRHPFPLQSQGGGATSVWFMQQTLRELSSVRRDQWHDNVLASRSIARSSISFFSNQLIGPRFVANA